MGYPAFVRASKDQPDEEFWVRLPEALKQDLLAYIAAYTHPEPDELDGPCYWYDEQTHRCKHHLYRPRVCRDFAVGGRDCLAWRKEYSGQIERQL